MKKFIRFIWTVELITAIVVLIVKACTTGFITLNWFWCWALVWIPFALFAVFFAIYITVYLIRYQTNGIPRKYGKLLYTTAGVFHTTYHCEKGDFVVNNDEL